MTIRIGMDQNIGVKRPSLEDAYFAGELTTAGGERVVLAVVADGIGGAAAGERASALTIERISESVRRSSGSDFPRILEAALRAANRAVYEEAQQNEDERDMGSTAVAVIVCGDRFYLASVGDSRAYLVRNGKAVQLTTDHTFGEEMIRAGKLRPEEAARNPHAGALVRSIGTEAETQVDLGVYWNARESETAARARQGTVLQPGDRLLLCSDGLIKNRPDGRGHFVETGEFGPILFRNPPPQAARKLVGKALSRNANDNVSVIVLEKPAGAARKLLRGFFLLALAAAWIAAGAAFLPPLLEKLRPATPVPISPSIIFGRVTGEVLYKESGRVPTAVSSAGTAAVRIGGSLQSLEGTAQFTLPDSTRVYLDRFSEVALSQLGDPQTGAPNTLLTLEQGRLLIVAAVRPGSSVSLAVPGGLRAQVLGTVMGLSYDPGTARLEVDCLEGACLLASSDAVLQLSGGQSAWGEGGALGSLGEADYARWAGLWAGDPEWITATPQPSATATPTPTATSPSAPVRTTEPPPPPGAQPSPTPEATSTDVILPSPEPPTVEPPATDPPPVETTPAE
jgi:serine/threonine protein phosphatase PrpC